MSGELSLEVITPRGQILKETGLDKVVLRRREPSHELGSQVVILPSHGPLLIQTPSFTLTWTRDDVSGGLSVAAGVAEVLEDRVLVITSGTG